MVILPMAIQIMAIPFTGSTMAISAAAIADAIMTHHSATHFPTAIGMNICRAMDQRVRVIGIIMGITASMIAAITDITATGKPSAAH